MDTGVYLIENVANGRRYVGSAVSLKKRWREHRRQLAEGKHHSRFLQRAWDKYGPLFFRFQVAAYCDRDNLLLYEQRLIDGLKPDYNTSPTAGSQLGYRHTDETRRKMSQSRAKDFSPMKGRKHTAEAKKKISENRKGKGGGPRAPERLAKISAALKGRPCPEHRKKMISATLTGTTTGRGKMTEAQVRSIRQLWATGLRKFEIARELGIKPSWVNTVVDGHGYGWVD